MPSLVSPNSDEQIIGPITLTDEKTRAEQFVGLPENVVDMAVKRREWNGMRLDVTSSRCTGRVHYHLCHESEARLAVPIEEVGVLSEGRLRQFQPCPVEPVLHGMYYVPAGMDMWGYSADMRFVRDANLSFDIARLRDCFGSDLDWAKATEPRWRFADDRIWSMVKLLADAVDNKDPSAQLFGDGLTAALVALLFGREVPLDAPKGLAPWQLRRVLDYIEAQLPRQIELGRLASLVGLSQSQFGRAFKASTGVAPYQWQLDVRIRRAQALLLDTDLPLDSVAAATGFNDAVHLGHVFKKRVGAAPVAWRNERKV